jgi:hypothetical protein
MTRMLTLVAVLLAIPAAAFAGVVTAPEIDANTAVAALALVSGAALVLRGRRSR